jgi:4-amino-4-deoxychorismate lyase
MSAAPVIIWVDGEQQATLPLPDRGLDYGDGLFETLLVKDGRAVYLDLHMERLALGLEILGFPHCLALVEHQISTAVAAAPLTGEAIMRVTVTRGEGKRGYAPPLECRPRIIVVLSAYPERDFKSQAKPAELVLAQMRWSNQPALAGIKHLNRLEQVLASQERLRADADEAIMLDQAGNVVSVCAGNLFIITDNILYTPALVQCGIKGTRRRLVLEMLAPRLGIEMRETQVSLGLLKAASEVFYCNTVQGIRPVARFESSTWDNHPVCEKIHQLYVEEAS